MLRFFATTLCIVLSHMYSVWAQTDTINVKNKKLLIRQLKPTKRQYMVYLKIPQKNNLITNVSLWTREVSFQKDMVVISQQWSGQDTLTNRKLWSLCKKDNFEPVYHYTYMPKMGVAAFNFGEKQITGADSVSSNTKKDFQVGLKHPTFNWELDLETFEMLPLGMGKTFIIDFYHPGGSQIPAYYTYKVTGSEKIGVSTGKEIDCWMLRIDYNTDSYATFWITKQNPEVLKMEEFYKGVYRYKVKLVTSI
ncbi:hypothetical protein [Xanthocytophaga agilis]|uniref:Uncharacterized protein n=1 Tax=Xanthocytophaga agilis TaxID=3048010 RepID=A0AAE3R6F4_9BACT|nr:hypothetical protein [Xanthocytophaga agilis]MDJ1504501.1 hypothetical protein [Xanthocytophaga agilis]